MDAKAPTDLRMERGLAIAQTCRIRKTNEGWLVPSQSGRGCYTVNYNYNEHKCTCPDHITNNVKCKHLWAVEFVIRKQVDSDGNVKTSCHVTYSQNWHAYNTAQQTEKAMFMELLSDLCDSVEEPIQTFGRPKLLLKDMVFSSVFKVYSLYSLRRFTTDLKDAKDKNLIDSVPCFASIGHFFQREDITELLTKMIIESSLPLKSVESNFAIDSSGFSTTRFARYFSFRHGKDHRYQAWIKAHLVCGVKTNIVTAVKLTDQYQNDNMQFNELVTKTSENFTINEVSADKGYNSNKSLQLVDSLGGTAYIPFKSNCVAKARSKRLWKKMYHLYMFNHEEFMSHYHKRSNVETTFHMIKTKFGDAVKSKTMTAQMNEVLCKILCHNICVVIQEMHENNISKVVFK